MSRFSKRDIIFTVVILVAIGLVTWSAWKGPEYVDPNPPPCYPSPWGCLYYRK